MPALSVPLSLSPPPPPSPCFPLPLCLYILLPLLVSVDTLGRLISQGKLLHCTTTPSASPPPPRYLVGFAYTSNAPTAFQAPPIPSRPSSPPSLAHGGSPLAQPVSLCLTYPASCVSLIPSLISHASCLLRLTQPVSHVSRILSVTSHSFPCHHQPAHHMVGLAIWSAIAGAPGTGQLQVKEPNVHSEGWFEPEAQDEKTQASWSYLPDASVARPNYVPVRVRKLMTSGLQVGRKCPSAPLLLLPLPPCLLPPSL